MCLILYAKFINYYTYIFNTFINTLSKNKDCNKNKKRKGNLLDDSIIYFVNFIRISFN